MKKEDTHMHDVNSSMEPSHRQLEILQHIEDSAAGYLLHSEVAHFLGVHRVTAWTHLTECMGKGLIGRVRPEHSGPYRYKLTDFGRKFVVPNTGGTQMKEIVQPTSEPSRCVEIPVYMIEDFLQQERPTPVDTIFFDRAVVSADGMFAVVDNLLKLWIVAPCVDGNAQKISGDSSTILTISDRADRVVSIGRILLRCERLPHSSLTAT